MISNIEAHKGSQLPGWVKSAAKLLNGGSEGQDWTALAKKLGKKIRKTPECLIRVTGSHELIFSGLESGLWVSGQRKSTSAIR
jgi:hypothetical protein